MITPQTALAQSPGEQSSSGGDCYVSPDAPLGLSAELGTMAVATCIDGEIVTSVEFTQVAPAANLDVGVQAVHVCQGVPQRMTTRWLTS